MATFTIDAEDNITAFATPDHAQAAVGAGAQPFTSQQELAALAVSWPAARLVAIWNSLPGVTPVKKFRDAKTAIRRLWARIQGLGEPDKPQAGQKAKGSAQAAQGAPKKGKSGKKGHPGPGRAQGQKGRQGGAASRRAARG